MATFTPQELTKGGETETAETAAEYWHLIWDGWLPLTELPLPPNNNPATRGYVDDAVASLPGKVDRDSLMLNILDYAVTRGTSSSQTAAIKAAFDANSGKAFYFPPGDYRLDEQLNVTSSNSILLAEGARIYAGATMDTLINWDNGQASANFYAQDKGITGFGTIDAALKADKAIAIGSVIRFTLGDGLTIVNPIKRGLLLKANGAEVITRNLRIHNTGTTNVVDNIGIEVAMSDCHFSDIIIRDFTVGIWDKGSAVWHNTHPWLGTATQLAARFPTSVAALIESSPTMFGFYSDTYRYAFRVNNSAARARIIAPRIYTNEGNLSGALAIANPGAAFDLTAPGLVNVTDGTFIGHSAAPFPFVNVGVNSIRFNARGNVNLRDMTGVADYMRGVKLGSSTFVPSVAGSTVAGTHTYTAREGRMEVRDGFVTYFVRLEGTLDSTLDGNLRISGLPLPPGAVSTGVGHGPIVYSHAANDANGLIGGNGSAATQSVIVTKSASNAATEVGALALRTKVIRLWGSIDCPFTYPS